MAAAGAASNILIRFGQSGMAGILRALTAVRAAAARLGNSISGVSGQIAASVSRIGGVASTLAGIGAAVAALGAGGVLAINTALDKMGGLAAEAAAEVDRLFKAAKGYNLRDGIQVGGLEYAFEQEGAADKVEPVVGRLIELARKARAGEEEAMRLLAMIGANWEDIIDDNGEIRNTVDMIAMLSDSYNELGDAVSKNTALVEVFGAGDGPAIANLFNAGSEAIRGYVREWETLVDIRQGDYAIAAAYNDQINRESKAWLGVKNAIGRGYLPSMTRASELRQRFFMAYRDEIAVISEQVGGYLDRITPTLLEAGEMLIKMLSGSSDQVVNSPLKSFFEGMVGAVEAFANGLVDVMSYLTTGETDVGWIQTLAEYFEKVQAALPGIIKGIGEFWRDLNDNVIPVIREAVEGLSNFLSMLGVDGSAAQFGIMAGLLTFGGVLAGIVASLASIVSSLGAMPALLSALPLAGVWKTLKDTFDLRDEFDGVTDHVKKLAQTHGEAYAAAYLRAYIDQAPEEFRGAGWANKLGAGVDSILGTNFAVDYDDSIRRLDVIIEQGLDQGAAQDIIDGTIAAFRGNGWDVDENGQVAIGAGLYVEGVDFAGAVDGTLSNLAADLHISRIVGFEEALEDYASALSGYNSAVPSHVSRDAVDSLKGPGGELWQQLEDTLSANERTLEELRKQKPVTINIGDLQVPALVEQNVLDRMRRSYSHSGRTRS